MQCLWSRCVQCRRPIFRAKCCRRQVSGFSGQIRQLAVTSQRTTHGIITFTIRRSSRSARLCRPSPGIFMSSCITWLRRHVMSSRCALWRGHRLAATPPPSTTGLLTPVINTDTLAIVIVVVIISLLLRPPRRLCLFVRKQDYTKSFHAIFMKLCRIMYCW